LFVIAIMEKNLIGWFFGKKKTVKKVSKKRVKPSKKLIVLAKKYGVKVTIKRGSRRVWKSKRILVKQIKRAMKKKKGVKKSKASKKLSRFGTVGGRYMPLSSVLSPYPRAVTSGSPFI